MSSELWTASTLRKNGYKSYDKVKAAPWGGFFYAFFTNSLFSIIDPNPSTLQLMLWSPSTSLIRLTLVPGLIGLGAPFTGNDFMTVTLSPSCRGLPFASRTTCPCGSSFGFHSLFTQIKNFRIRCSNKDLQKDTRALRDVVHTFKHEHALNIRKYFIRKSRRF